MEYLATCREAAIIVGTEQHRALVEVGMDTPKDASSKDALARAVDHCASGEWQQAHEIVQKDDSMLAAWIHGVVHLLEGDLVNAQGWYRKTDRAYPGPEAVQAEIAAARRAVHGAG